jgi:hypothetical protein
MSRTGSCLDNAVAESSSTTAAEPDAHLFGGDCDGKQFAPKIEAA